ncbi:MAG: response regulator transcription factor [Bacillota bacterium]|nr:response regulator transcription factor [Bacillota bacterium]
MSIKLLIADDDSLIRESLKIIIGLDEDFEIIHCVENGLEAVKGCKNSEVDVALLDVRMPIMNGVESAGEICRNTNTKVIILTTFDEDEFIMKALQNGAQGYILKNNTPDKIKDTIKMVYNGAAVVQDVVLERVKAGLNSNAKGLAQEKKIDRSLFTERELDVMKAIAQGYSNKGISQKLFISEGTVKNYITSILNKTGLEHRTQIAIYYLKGGQ